MPNLTRKQAYDQSCGAACLVVSALELGIDRIPDIPAQIHAGKELKLDMTTETILYQQLTGGKLNGYSFPSKMAITAKQLGFNVTIYLHGRVIPWLLQKQYPDEIAACVSNGISVMHTAPEPLDMFSRLICVVSVGGIAGLHYVLYRPDNTYMDPAYGTNHTGSLIKMGQAYIFRYIDTGIYIRLTINNTLFMA